MKILLLSAYDAASHRYWREQLEHEFAAYHWTQLALPPRYFNWRVRGNAMSWALQQSDVLQAGYDLLFATSMVDLATLRGLIPALAVTPSILYFHENQFCYPATHQQKHTLEPQMVSLYSGLAADRLVFNSAFNRDTYFSGVAQLLKKLPDQVPAGIVDRLSQKSLVLPVAISLPVAPQPQKENHGVFELLWNHRWEYDKGPQQLLAALQRLPSHLALRVHVVGQQFRKQPGEFDDIKSLLDARGWCGEWGFIADSQHYQDVLQNSDAVLSTSLHDFQGLAVLEGVASGCVPIVPDRLAYRELFPAEFRYQSFCSPSDPISEQQISLEADACAAAIETASKAWQSSKLSAAPDIAALSMDSLATSYRRLIESTAAVGISPPSAVTIPGHSA